MTTDDLMDEFYLKVNNNVRCGNCKEIFAPRTQLYKFEKVSKVLWFNLNIGVNQWIGG